MSQIASLELTDVDGRSTSLTAYAGQPLVVQLARFYG